MAKKKRKKASSSNRRGMAGIVLVVFTLLSVLLIQSNKLEAKNSSYIGQQAQLEEQIQEEKDRAEEISNLPAYTESKEYIEKMAREKFGLVYEDEIIFRSAE